MMMMSHYFIRLKTICVIIMKQNVTDYATWSGSRPVSSRMESNSGGLSSVVSASPMTRILPVIDSGYCDYNSGPCLRSFW